MNCIKAQISLLFNTFHVCVISLELQAMSSATISVVSVGIYEISSTLAIDWRETLKALYFVKSLLI